MNRLRKAVVVALMVVCALASTPALYAGVSAPTPGRLALFDAGGWVRGWLAWLGGLFERDQGGPLAGATGDEGGCVDPWGTPKCRP